MAPLGARLGPLGAHFGPAGARACVDDRWGQNLPPRGQNGPPGAKTGPKEPKWVPADPKWDPKGPKPAPKGPRCAAAPKERKRALKGPSPFANQGKCCPSFQRSLRATNDHQCSSMIIETRAAFPLAWELLLRARFEALGGPVLAHWGPLCLIGVPSGDHFDPWGARWGPWRAHLAPEGSALATLGLPPSPREGGDPWLPPSPWEGGNPLAAALAAPGW